MSVDSKTPTRANGLAASDGLPIDSDTQARIYLELETLNEQATKINELEKGLHARRKEQNLLDKSFKTIRRRYDTQIRKAQPFFTILAEAKKKQQEVRDEATKFEKASDQLAAAKQKMALAETELLKVASSPRSEESRAIDLPLQEVLNNATIKVHFDRNRHIVASSNQVVEAEKKKRLFEQLHQTKANELNVVVRAYTTTERKLRSTLRKLKPYLQERQRCVPRIQELRCQISAGQDEVVAAKSLYQRAMRNLERLSEEMHKQRAEDNDGDGNDEQDFMENIMASALKYNPLDTRHQEVCTSMSDCPSFSVSDLGSISDDSPVASLVGDEFDILARCIVQSCLDAAVSRVLLLTDSSFDSIASTGMPRVVEQFSSQSICENR